MAKILVVTLSEGLTDWEVNKLVSKIEKMQGVESVEVEEDIPPIEETSSTEPITTDEPYVVTGEVVIPPVIPTKEDNREQVVYEWVDPERNLPVYIGHTVDFTSRIATQLRDARKPSLGKWLFLQKQLGRKPIVRQVTKVKGERAAESEENNRIEELTAQGIALINRTQGNISVLEEVNVQFLK